jgi:K+-transporting ATPase ATPase C chain
MRPILAELKTALIATLTLGFLVCGIYPLVVWSIAEGVFTHQANGSMIHSQGKNLGSELIGQKFSSPNYFHSRPSFSDYDATQSGGSNLGPTSKKLIDNTQQRAAAYRQENGLASSALIPADAVSASASGLDPHISLENALLQAARIAKARGITEEAVHAKIQQYTEDRTLGILGEPRVNVLKLNLALDTQ